MKKPPAPLLQPEAPTPAPAQAPVSALDDAPPANTGSGAASALARMKQWERSRAKMRESGRDKPGEKPGNKA